ncbi:MAG: hypothetical protein J6Y24_07585 [Bacteroidales bacterium]|nr:hypothetical protein [Bacteroidales bacterium]
MKLNKEIFGFLLLLIFIFVAPGAYTQNIESIIKSDLVKMGGNLSVNTTSELLEDSTLTTDRFYYYLSGGISTQLFGFLNVPFTFAYTNNVLTKNLALPYNRFSIAPNYKKLTVYMGYNSMSFGKYTLSGHDYLGAGALYEGDVWHIEGFYGRMRKAVQPDSTNAQPSYKRMGGGFKIGYKNEKYQLGFDVIKVKDDMHSISFNGYEQQYIEPKDNVATSVRLSTTLWKNLDLSGEYGLSMLNKNMAHLDTVDNHPSDILLEYYGEKVYYHAFDIAISYHLGDQSVGFGYSRIPPNYETLGGYYFAEDEEAYTVNFATLLFKRISFTGDVGLRHDNLDKQKISTDNSVAINLAASGNITEKLNFNISYNNNQQYLNLRNKYEELIRTTEFENLDTTEYSRLNNTTNVGLNYMLSNTETASNSISASFMYQTTSDHQRYDTTSANSKIYNGNVGYNLSLIPQKMSASITFGYNRTEMPTQITDMYTTSVSFTKTLFDKVSASLSGTHAYTKMDSITSNVVNGRLSLSYTLKKSHNFSFSLNYINSSQLQGRKNERLTMNLGYALSFDIINREKNKQEDETNH